MSNCPNQSPKKHIPKSLVCERNSLLSFSFVISLFLFFKFHSVKTTLLAGPHCFPLLPFFDTMFSVFFYCSLL